MLLLQGLLLLLIWEAFVEAWYRWKASVPLAW